MGLDFYKKLLLKTPSDKRRKRHTPLNYPPELRGPANNKYGGHQAQSLRGFRVNTYGPAGPVKQYTPEEIAEWEKNWLGQTSKPSPSATCSGGEQQAGHATDSGR
jgi:hypothetical protein